jgi:hypothetical protein
MIVVRPRHLAAAAVAAIVLTFATPNVVRAQDSTASIRYKGITLTPIGFVAAEGVWRQRNITADIGSSFSAIPFSGTTNGNMTESRLTGRQSRLGLLAQGAVGATRISGYWESDFLGVGTSSNSNESNSYVLRLRQFWGSASFDNGWTLSAGQMWSLVTPNKSGMLNRSEAVPLTIEAQYAVGFDWARQFGFRAVTKLGDEASFGIAIEESQTTFSGRNLPADFVIGQVGGQLLNATTTYSTDYSPDLVLKLAFDPKGFGHWEVKAVGSEMRDRVIDPTNVSGGTRNVTNMAYGVGAGVWFPISNGTRSIVDLGLSGMYGKGIGRYGTSQLPDATVDTDGSLKPITAAQALASIEIHPTTKLDIYLYGGAEYADRTAFVNGAGAGVGYGSPLNNNSGCQTEAAPTNQTTPNSGTCNADNRAFWQGNAGFWYRFYRGSAGTLQWGLQYSYTSRNTWSGAASIQPQAIDNMGFASFRYVLPE